MAWVAGSKSRCTSAYQLPLDGHVEDSDFSGQQQLHLVISAAGATQRAALEVNVVDREGGQRAKRELNTRGHRLDADGELALQGGREGGSR